MKTSSAAPRPVPTTPEHDALRGHLLALYAAALESRAPSDDFLSGYLRRNKALRGSARGFLGATFFALLRRRVRTLLLAARWRGESPDAIFPAESIAPTMPPTTEAALTPLRWLVEDCALAPAEAVRLLLAAGGDAEVAPFADFLAARDRADEDLALETSVPPWLLQRWSDHLGADIAAGLGRSLGKPAPLDIRANPAIASREALLEALNAAATEPLAIPTPHAPLGVRLLSKINLASVQGLAPGSHEVQDEGSQLVVEALGGFPARGRVLDACAGAGGKALNIAARYAEESPRIDATDADQARLERLVPRAGAAHSRGIRVLPIASLSEAAVYEAVLVDAPCMGLGRLRRDPASAWRGSFSERMEQAVRQQRECLLRYASFVRPGGILVYAVCSFEREETVGAVEWLRAQLPYFVPDPLPPLFQTDAFAPTRAADGSAVTLLPSLHGTDGFFIARWRRGAPTGDWRKFLLTSSAENP